MWIRLLLIGAALGMAVPACKPSGPKTALGSSAEAFDVENYAGAELALGLRSGMSVEEAQAALKKQGVITSPTKGDADYVTLEWKRGWAGDPGPADLVEVRAELHAAGLDTLMAKFLPDASRYTSRVGALARVCQELDDNRLAMRPTDVLEVQISREGTLLYFQDHAMHRKSEIARGEGEESSMWGFVFANAKECKEPAELPPPVRTKAPADVRGRWVVKPNEAWKKDDVSYMQTRATAAESLSDSFEAWLKQEDRVIEITEDRIIFPIQFTTEEDGSLEGATLERRYRYEGFGPDEARLTMETKAGDPDGRKGAAAGTTRVVFSWKDGFVKVSSITLAGGLAEWLPLEKKE